MKTRILRIVDELRKNSRRSLTDIATSTDTPLSTVFKHVNRLFKQGIVKKTVAVVDFVRIGYPYKIGIFVSTNKKDEFQKIVLEKPDLNALLRLSGDYDFYTELVFKDLAALQDLLDELKEKEIAKNISTHFITDIRQEEFQIRA